MEIKQKILLAAFELYMKYGVKSVSMDDISRKIGVSKKTLYTVIENKEDLIEQMIGMHICEDQKQINAITLASETAIDEMAKIGKHVISFLREMTPSLVYDLVKYYPQQWKIIQDNHYCFIYETIKKNIERGIEEGYYIDTINADVIAKLYEQKTHCIIDQDHFPLSQYVRSALYEELFGYHMRGIVSEKGAALLKSVVL